MSERKKTDDAGRAQPGLPGEARPASLLAASARRSGPEERRALLAAYAASGQTMQAFCAERHVSTETLCAWRRALAARGEQGLIARTSRRNAAGRTGPQRSPDERRALIEAFEPAGLTVRAFARTRGASEGTLRDWLARYRGEGPAGLEPKRARRPKGSGSGSWTLPRAEVSCAIGPLTPSTRACGSKCLSGRTCPPPRSTRRAGAKQESD